MNTKINLGGGGPKMREAKFFFAKFEKLILNIWLNLDILKGHIKSNYLTSTTSSQIQTKLAE